MQTYMKTEHCIPNKINKLKKIVDVSADDLGLEVVCDWAPSFLEWEETGAFPVAQSPEWIYKWSHLI